jgi:hypothetical protein
MFGSQKKPIFRQGFDKSQGVGFKANFFFQNAHAILSTSLMDDEINFSLGIPTFDEKRRVSNYIIK